VASTSSQGSEDDHLTPHQARLKAAASAASVYEKSFVYAPTSTYSGYIYFVIGCIQEIEKSI